jgi:hypothetical protein
VYFLENRVEYLNEILLKHKINFHSAVSFNDDGANYNTASKSNPTPSAKVESAASSGKISDEVPLDTELPEYSNSLDSAILDLLSGRDTKLEITRVNELKGRPSNLQTSAHPSLFRFGFESTAKGTMELPDREMADRLVDEYFIHTNLHVPVLNRPDFEKILDRIYDSEGSDYPKDQLYFAFIVFAIGAASVTRSHEVNPGPELHFGVGSRKRKRSSIEFRAAEEYHASAITCLEHCLDSCGNFNLFGDFEGLQALILLCSFALFKSTSPGLGNLLDIAIRSAIDLRLYSEQESPVNMTNLSSNCSFDEAHRDWIKDLRRRLWWCVYSLDRLVAPYLERPFFIPDDVITTQFPSILDDRFITRRGILTSVDDKGGYKYAVRHRFRFRILQSEMHTVLQYHHARLKRGEPSSNLNRRKSLSRSDFSSFSSWRQDIHSRLERWRDCIPTLGSPSDRFLMELDFWQSIIALYRWSVKIPPNLVHAPVTNTSTIQPPSNESPEEVDWICFKVAEATSNALHIHHMMQNIGCSTTPYIITHEVFLAGENFKY